ncbi:hypothetical protein BTH42_26895 [Burkholderia sp. SRS-W-2-2016]|uniref:autotransporter outer membrane beta-barrel domain-containing protein n=1 Tax=Burkholderia sp. SRS-W-2-2016 TaxID=1926878 RepID=UPI00094B52D8|nr:autotransporter outer membrane beta-barrel domain-containing protein [Burkholderia sp. SRS-W-2-2016]OLL28626.1 hypothetical protein BTH42_26895 [Burkholderia sp. SRS-W-2-2016]
MSVETGGSAVIAPDEGSAPGDIVVYSHYRSGAPNDGLYVSSGRLTVNGSAHGHGTYVTTDGLDVFGIYAPYSSSKTAETVLDATNLYITTSGDSADGIRVYGTAFGAPVITLRDSSITTSSGFASAYGVCAWGGATVNLINTALSALGTATYGITASASTIHLSNGTVTTVAPSAYALYVYSGSTLTVDGTAISTSGTSGIGLYASSSNAALTGARFSTAGDNAHGIYATGADISVNGGSIVTSGASAHGVWLTNGSHGVFDGSSIDVRGASTRGLYVNGAGTTAAFNDGRISTAGANGYGVYGTSGAVVTTQGGSVSTSGAGAYAFWIAGAASATLSGTALTTSGSNAYGLLVGGTSASATTSDVAVNTSGSGASGYYVWSTGILRADGGTVATTGNNAAGVVVDGLSSAALGRDAAGAGVSVTTSGTGANAVRVSNGGSFSATGASLHARGAGGNGVYLTGTATLGVGAAPGDAAGVDAPPAAPGIDTSFTPVMQSAAVVHASGPQENLTLTDTTVQSDNGAGIYVAGGIANVGLSGSTVTGATAAIQATTATLASTVTIAADSSTLNGAVLTDTGSSTSLDLSNGSRWNVTGDSTVTTLQNAASLIDFQAAPTLAQAPTVASSYRTVHVTGDYAGANGSVALNTWLNAGGALGAQFTDRLLVAGNASGVTQIDVKPVAASPGGLTAPSGLIGPDEGISVVQVAGNSTQGAFRLAGDYVVAPDSPYTYRLYAYGPQSSHGASDASQQLVGSGGAHWDYRLQSAYVTPEGPVDPEDLPGPGPGPSPEQEIELPIPSDARPAVAPQIAAYLSAPVAFLYAGMLDMDMLHRRLGEIRDDGPLGRDGGDGEMFFRAYGGDFRYSSNIGFQQFGYDMSGDYSAIQFGANAFTLRNTDGLWRFGLAGTVGWLHFEPEAVDGPSSSRSNIFRFSGYGTYQSRQGWYFDGILSAGWFNGHVDTSARGQTMKLQGNAYAASMEAGYPVALPYRLHIEPQIQLVGQHLSFHNSFDADDLDVNIGAQNQLVGRLGVRLTRPFDVSSGLLTPYAAIDLLHSFTDGTSVQVSGVQFTSGKLGDALQYSLGLNGTPTARLSLYGRVSYQQAIGNAGVRGWLFNAGARYLF